MNQKSRLTLIENTHNQNLQNSLETKLNLNRGWWKDYVHPANSAKLSSELVLDFLEKKVEEKKNMCEKYGEGRGEEYLEKDDIWSTEEIKQTTWQIFKSHLSYCMKQKI